MFSRDGLQFRLPSDMYKESHVLSHASSRLRADPKVQAVLDAKVSRESEWSRKMSFGNAAVCERYVEAAQGNDWLTTKRKIKQTLQSEQRDLWRDKIQPLVFQGDFLRGGGGDLIWRSIIFDLPNGVVPGGGALTHNREFSIVCDDRHVTPSLHLCTCNCPGRTLHVYTWSDGVTCVSSRKIENSLLSHRYVPL